MKSDSDAGDRDLFWSLARRYNELGRLLPREEDLHGGNVAEARLVLAEMDKVEKEFRAVLARNAWPPLCEECGNNCSDPPSKLCPGCQAYQEHQR